MPMIREKQPVTEVVIDLTGSEGNAFHMMAHAKSFARELGMDGSATVSYTHLTLPTNREV